MIQTFDNLFILGRPAGGKSEFIDFLQHREDELRAERYHIGKLQSIDDFVWVWEKFIEDDLWEKVGRPRYFSKKYDGNNYGVEDHVLYDWCMEKFNRQIQDDFLSRPEWYGDHTLLVEFARGMDNPYAGAFPRLEKPIWEKAAIFFLDVSYEESWRKNVARYEEKLAHSILAHMVPREVHEKHYLRHDWEEVTDGRPNGYLELQGVRVPFITVPNEPQIVDHVLMDERYGPALDTLWTLYQER